MIKRLNPYKFMCDVCGASASQFTTCRTCKQPMTMYSRYAQRPKRLAYFNLLDADIPIAPSHLQFFKRLSLS